MIKEVTKFISEITGQAIGSYLLCGHRPQDAPDECNVVLETAGGAVYFDIPDRVDKSIQVLSRARTYFTARDMSWAIFKILHSTAGWNLPFITLGIGYKAHVIEANTDPQYIGQDEKGRFEFSCNFIFRMKITGAWDYYEPIEFIKETVIVKTNTYSITTSDLEGGKAFVMNAAADKIFNLPSVGIGDIGSKIILGKVGTGKLTIQTADSDTIHDSSAGGTLYNALATETYVAVRLILIQETKWIIIGMSGTGWITT